ncbi:MAG: HAD-IIB family hydrolase [Chromatiaceae bacterium]|jgi:hypothetical protein|nr:HAD-IIB family hydrolase [Chromatiaceae bacterium]
MRYLALVTDYDGTLTQNDRLADATAAALGRLRASGRRAILVTGRRLDELFQVCPCTKLFDYVVAENGALVFESATGETTLLADPPSPALVDALRERRVEPLEVGQVIVATRRPHEGVVLDLIQRFGLELQVIFNRAAVMVLPAGVNKASGVRAALRKLGMSPHEAVGVGDAENDHSFLRLCECAVAVGNAVDAVKQMAALVTQRPAGAGVAELIDELVATDLASVDARLVHRHIALGVRLDGTNVLVPPYGGTILVAGPSGSGKSTFATGFVERLAEQLYQFCIIDPEGDYISLQNAVTIGDQHRPPGIDEVLAVLRDPEVNVNVNLLGVRLADRPEFLANLLPHLQTMRGRTGRPHWLMVDEAHHMFPVEWGAAPYPLPQTLGETLLLTVHPDHLAAGVLAMVDAVVAVGAAPDRTLAQFATATARPPIAIEGPKPRERHVVGWVARSAEAAFPMRVIPGRAERLRHHRKYAIGDVRYNSFYFRGPHGRLNLKAQNLAIFCQIGEGVDDETWLFHLQRGDYSRWLREVIKDPRLADLVQGIERQSDLPPAHSRRLVRDAIAARYTLPE